MITASIKEIKTELSRLNQAALVEACLSLAKYKTENKELLSYLLFEQQQEEVYVQQVKELLHNQFQQINTGHLYFAKKSLRKIIRLAHRYSKYSKDKTTEVQLLIYVLQQTKALQLNLSQSVALQKIISSLYTKVTQRLFGLHPDLQYDYLQKLKYLVPENF